MLPYQIEKRPFQKVNFFVKLKKKKEILQTTFKAIFYITLGFISDINTQDKVKISSIDTDANSRESQVDAANTQNKLESETRP